MQNEDEMREVIEAALRTHFEDRFFNDVQERLDSEREDAVTRWEEQRSEELHSTLTEEFEANLGDAIEAELTRLEVEAES